jgi:hypothetical protein
MIVNRPHNLPLWLERRSAALSRLEAEAAAVAALFAESDDPGLLATFARYGGADPEAASDINGLPYLAKRLDGYLPLRQLRENLDAMRAHGWQFLRYACSATDYARPLDERHRAALEALSGAEAGAEFYGYDAADPATQDADYHASMRALSGLRRLKALVDEAAPLVEGTVAQARVLQDIRNHELGGRVWRPAHGETEVLWHASSHARELAAAGFSLVRPEGRRGLGNYGEVEDISFTHEPEIARNLARCLREMWGIAHGRTTCADLVALVRAEGLDARFDVASLVGLGKPLDAMSGEAEAAKLYRVYLALSERREDPCFTYPEETVAALADIGVVECEVRLEPGDEYLVGESEFRVGPERVLWTRLADEAALEGAWRTPAAPAPGGGTEEAPAGAPAPR